MNSEEHKQLLIDPRWQKKKSDICNRDGWKCVKCGKKTESLHVHHLIYPPSGLPWDIADIYLQTLCKTHYDEANGKPRGVAGGTPADRKMSEMFSVRELAKAFQSWPEGEKRYVDDMLEYRKWTLLRGVAEKMDERHAAAMDLMAAWRRGKSSAA